MLQLIVSRAASVCACSRNCIRGKLANREVIFGGSMPGLSRHTTTTTDAVEASSCVLDRLTSTLESQDTTYNQALIGCLPSSRCQRPTVPGGQLWAHFRPTSA